MSKQTVKQKSDRTATVSAFDADLRRHLRALGLGDANAYRAWCRQYGFGESLTKTWLERRQERDAAGKAKEDRAAEAALQTHLTALGLADTRAYEDWCWAHGLSATPGKSAGQRQKELRLAQEERARTALTSARRVRRHPQEMLHGLFDGTVASEEPLTAPLQKVREVIGLTEGKPKVREALRRLLLHAQKHTHLLSVEPAVSHFGPAAGNTCIEGLLALARHQATWERPVEEWRPNSRNAGRQFGSLARHLLARYAVPSFLDAAWFGGGTDAARAQQAWFIHMGRGENIRTASLPLRLTKRAAHLFLGAPGGRPIPAAFRWAQVTALGSAEPLTRALLGTRLGEFQADEEFWESVLHFFVNHPLLDTACVGPMADFIQHRKFTPEEATGEPLEPNFSMKGRTPAALQERVDEWHQMLARPSGRKAPLTWEPSGLGGFRSERGAGDDDEPMHWVIEELLTQAALREEGKAMRHCVASYARSCANGQKSVWSLAVEDCRSLVRRRVMTIAVKNGSRTVVEARGRFNKTPDGKHVGARLHFAPEILTQWAAQEGLTVPSYVGR